MQHIQRLCSPRSSTMRWKKSFEGTTSTVGGFSTSAKALELRMRPLTLAGPVRPARGQLGHAYNVFHYVMIPKSILWLKWCMRDLIGHLSSLGVQRELERSSKGIESAALLETQQPRPTEATEDVKELLDTIEETWAESGWNTKAGELEP
jgi:hypothetical protein